jgi:hypothetical protein
MGNFGGMIAARSGALEELLRSAGIAGGEAWELHDGWQCASFPEAGEIAKAVREIAAQTGAPTVGAFFMDSDFGVVEAATDARATWSGILDQRLAEEYGAPVDEYPADLAVDQALGWSRTAGLDADENLIRVAFTQSRVFAEDLYHTLLVGLGIPGAAIPHHDDDFDDKYKR